MKLFCVCRSAKYPYPMQLEETADGLLCERCGSIWEWRGFLVKKGTRHLENSFFTLGDFTIVNAGGGS